MGKATVAVFTLVGVGTSFLTFQTIITALSSIDPNALVPCSNGCTFIRYFGGGGVPASAAAYLNCSVGEYCNATTPITANNTVNASALAAGTAPSATVLTSQKPGFIKITNGKRQIQFTEGTMGVLPLMGMEFWKTFVIPYDYSYATPLCPDANLSSMQEFCELSSTKRNFNNHLRDAPALKGLRIWIIIWAVFLSFHEISVLYDAPEVISVQLGYVATAAHICTTAAAFVWSTGATEVFLAEDPNGRPCGCYYQMPAMTCLVMLASPMLLQKTTWDMLWKTGLGVIHGDFFHTVSYSVPVRMVQSTHVSDPTTTFMPCTAVGDTQRAKPLGQRSMQHGPVFAAGLKLLKMLQGAVSGGVIVFFSAPTVMSKVMALTHDGIRVMTTQNFVHWTSPSIGVALAVTFACIFGPFYTMLQQHKIAQVLLKQIISMWRNLRKPMCNLDGEATPGVKSFKLFNRCTLLLVPVLSIFNGTISCWYLLGVWQSAAASADISPEMATDWGRRGFDFIAMFVSAYCFAGLPWMFIGDALDIKRGLVPILGLNYIGWLDEQFPILGLANEVDLASFFMHGTPGIDEQFSLLNYIGWLDEQFPILGLPSKDPKKRISLGDWGNSDEPLHDSWDCDHNTWERWRRHASEPETLKKILLGRKSTDLGLHQRLLG